MGEVCKIKFMGEKSEKVKVGSLSLSLYIYECMYVFVYVCMSGLHLFTTDPQPSSHVLSRDIQYTI